VFGLDKGDLAAKKLVTDPKLFRSVVA